MRLTHIKLAGFKSFVDPTTITVGGQLVAVIGPNGCGKSNVIDAVRWVLGEASAKQLRGESMQDVIFNGASSRKPALRASVELIFDNSAKQLQGNWGQYDEIAIKRQLTRQGDSNYYINNQPVRRRDITELFLGTGVGARGYAVIEQGMISRIIEAKPEELRTYIEEAAGISKYKERRRETENRLNHSRENLQRLADLQTELNRQIEKLQQQAKTAEQYQIWQKELTQHQNLLDYSQWQQSLAKADLATTAYKQHQHEQQHLQESINQQEQQIQQLRNQEHLHQQQLHDAEKQHATLREQWARLEEKSRYQRDWQQRLIQEKTQLQNRLQQLQHEHQNQSVILEQAQNQIEEQQLEREEWVLRLSEYELLLPETDNQLQQTTLALQNQQNELNRLERELAIQKQQQEHHEQNRIQLEQRQIHLQQELAELALPSEQEMQQSQSQLEQQKQFVAELEQQQIQDEHQQQQLKQQLKQVQHEYQELEKQKFTLTAQIQALAALLPQQDKTDFWAQITDEPMPVLWQTLEVTPQWQHAVSVILGIRLQARYHHQLNLPEFLPNSSAIWVNRTEQAIESALPANALLHHVQTKQPFNHCIRHWLQNVLCAPHLQSAIQQQNQLQAHQILITPEGHIIDAYSISLFGQDNNNHLLQRQQQLREHQQSLGRLTHPLQQAEQILQQTQQQLTHIENQNQQKQQYLKQQQQQLQTLVTQTHQLLTSINQGQLRYDHIQKELAHIKIQSQRFQQQLNSIDTDTLITAIEQLQQQQQLTQEQKQQQQQRRQQTQLGLLEAQRQQGLTEMNLLRLQQKIDQARHEQARIDSETEQCQERQSELATDLLQQQNNETEEEQIQLLDNQIKQAKQQCNQIIEILQNVQTELQEQQQQQQQLTNQLPELQTATQKTLLQQQEALLQARQHHETLQSHQANLEELATQWNETLKPQQLNQHITSLAKKIHALGAVNLAALQELEEVTNRVDYYQTQTTDVQSAITLLEEAISQIDNETKNRFKSTFEQVNSKVQNYFPILFGGGEAKLHMTGEDLLNAGVAIMAHPPGKKNSTIHLLSGGEKALTAMSLVFALFSLNPAPFCLLDEVDAPLDDANTGRFCQLVQQMSTQTQFLYISHNRLTMEMAEQLVGVTMQEKGVSRIVAVNIQQALDMAEPATK